MKQRIAFVRSKDKTNIAYALSGQGPPLVRAGTWLTHVHHDWDSPIWAHWLRFLSSRHTLVRYDPRGCGLSQAEIQTVSLDDWVSDLEAVVDRLAIESFALLGMSQGAAVAVEYAIRHPQRVSQLILYAPLVTGWRGRTDPVSQQWQAMEQLVLAGWGDGNMAFPSMFAHLFLPDSTPETRQLYSELQRKSASKPAANLLMQALATLSVFSRLKEIRVPTLVIQVARDQVIDPKLVPGISSAIPGSEFVSIDSANHILLESEPSWRAFTTLFAQRVAGGTGQLRRITDEQPPQFDRLSQREQQILHALAQGMSNRQIADRLRISEKTVRNHVTGIFDKLGVTSRAQAIVLAKESGF